MELPDTLTLYHNPKCGTSRTVLELVKASGRPYTVVEYLKTGWTLEQLKALLSMMGAGPRAILRLKEPLVKDKGLDGPEASDDLILAAMIEAPILVERPILSGPKGAAVCRPADRAAAYI